LGEGFTYIIGFLEAPLRVAADVALVRSGVDKLAFGHSIGLLLVVKQTLRGDQLRQQRYGQDTLPVNFTIETTEVLING